MSTREWPISSWHYVPGPSSPIQMMRGAMKCMDCGGVREGETVLISTDTNKIRIAEALASAAYAKGATPIIIMIPPVKTHGAQLPEPVVAAFREADVFLQPSTWSQTHIITQDLVNMLVSWRHSGFNVFCGPRIQPGDQQAMENLARYIIRASFSQERMTPYHVRGRLYIPEESKVSYQSKDGKGEKVFDALEWLAAMPACACPHADRCSHPPALPEITSYWTSI
jgi:hypothetical protein